jgi:ABC-type Zn2+ transport system substrate-binding protein/surface adhesin
MNLPGAAGLGPHSGKLSQKTDSGPGRVFTQATGPLYIRLLTFGKRRINMSHHHDHPHDHHHDHSDGHTHDHPHDHAQGDSHDHHHAHAHHSNGTLSFEEKMIKLLEHWIKHNADHADSYRDWAQKAQTHGMPDTGALLEEVAALTGSITGKFEQMLKTIKK